ncbi:MAG: hypothetical protein AVDCRST_MAG60-2407, partial [uncultured Nocardioides sp.]
LTRRSSDLEVPEPEPRTALICVMPAACWAMSALSTPGTSRTAASTASASSCVRTWAGSETPAGKDSPRRSAAAMASGSTRNWSAWSRPVSMR